MFIGWQGAHHEVGSEGSSCAFDRNGNRGGEPGDPVPAQQTIYRDREHPSHLLVSVLGNA